MLPNNLGCDLGNAIRSGDRAHPVAKLEQKCGTALAENAFCRFVTLVEDAGDSSVLADDRGAAVVPPCLGWDPVPLHEQQLIVGGEALTSPHHLGELRANHFPDVCPDLRAGPPQGPGMALSRYRRPGVVIEKREILPPVDGRWKAGTKADGQRRP